MAYGFNDKKEKVEVYSTSETYNKDEVYPKENFVEIHGTIANVGSFQSAQVDIDSGTLADYGIYNLRDYVIVGVMQRVRSSTVWVMPTYDANTNLTRPLANYPSASILRVFVYNGTGLAENVEYMVALMKVQGND